jgi:beta-mannosidase
MRSKNLTLNYCPLLAFLMVYFTFSCSTKTKLEEIEIKENWNFRNVKTQDWLPAVVPGCVYTDLITNGEIKDPNFRNNEDEVKWIADEDWEYKTSFDVPSGIYKKDNIELLFKGLDTYADVYLNGKLLLSADNMFRSWKVDCKSVLRKEKNILRIYFHSPIKEGRKKQKALPYLLPSNNELVPDSEKTSMFTRKASFQYGWKGGPRLITSGIWRPVVLRGWNIAQIDGIYLQNKNISASDAEYTANLEIKADQKKEIKLMLFIDGQKFEDGLTATVQPGTNTVKYDFSISKPELWWTNGLGGHKLYDLTFKLYDGSILLQQKTQKLGVRKIELVQQPDSSGQSFYFRLNGVPVFMKGASYVPQEVLTTKVTPERYQKFINVMATANINMLRVWGGGIYENDVFYDLCDEYGILVWQDFMFSGDMQPGDTLHLSNINSEAIDNVKRLRNHPCLALWCGNNEGIISWNNWGWKNKLNDKERNFVWNTYQKIFQHILLNAVKIFDPQTSYWPSTPSSGKYTLPESKSGDVHDWSIIFGNLPFENYKHLPGRFVSQYGISSFPEMRTIKTFSNKDDWYLDSSIIRSRQRANMTYIAPGIDSDKLINNFININYKTPSNFSNFVYVSQLMQAEFVKNIIETHRRNMPVCMGSLYWLMDDSWPTISFSGIDYYGKWKAMLYAMKKSFSEIIVSPTVENNKLKIYIVSDRLKPANALLSIKLLDFDGKELLKKEKEITIQSNSSKPYFADNIENFLTGFESNNILLYVSVTENSQVIAENIMYFEKPKDLKLQKPGIRYTIIKSGEKYFIELRTDKLARNVYLYTTDSEGFFSDNFFDLFPGKKIIIEYTPETKKKKLEQDLKIISLYDAFN